MILIKGLGSFSILNLETYGPIVWMIVGLNVDLLGEKIFFMVFLLGRVNAKEAPPLEEHALFLEEPSLKIPNSPTDLQQSKSCSFQSILRLIIGMNIHMNR